MMGMGVSAEESVSSRDAEEGVRGEAPSFD